METAPKMKGPLPAYVKQSAAAKCIGILSRISGELAESFLKYDVIKNLMYACGNSEYFSSQREAAVTLEVRFGCLQKFDKIFIYLYTLPMRIIKNNLKKPKIIKYVVLIFRIDTIKSMYK